jgi:hypothetical protein
VPKPRSDPGRVKRHQTRQNRLTNQGMLPPEVLAWVQRDMARAYPRKRDEMSPPTRYRWTSRRICRRRSKDAHSWIGAGRRACCDLLAGCARCSAGFEHGATCDRCSSRHRPGMGWLWLGLASGARTLEPVERRMGSTALRAEPLPRGLEPLWWRARSLRRMALRRRVGRLVQGLGWVRWRLIIHSHDVPTIAAGSLFRRRHERALGYKCGARRRARWR